MSEKLEAQLGFDATPSYVYDMDFFTAPSRISEVAMRALQNVLCRTCAGVWGTIRIRKELGKVARASTVLLSAVGIHGSN